MRGTLGCNKLARMNNDSPRKTKKNSTDGTQDKISHHGDGRLPNVIFVRRDK
jgi:hypothetical protein